jgi:hypothetical protein
MDHKYEDCAYCCDDVDSRVYLITDGCNGVYLDGNGFLVADDGLEMTETKMSYCPVCGRKL